MEEKLHKYKCDARPTQGTRQSTPNLDEPSPTQAESSGIAAEEIEADILSSLREEIFQVIREELKSAQAEGFNALKGGLQAVRSKIGTTTTAIT